MHSFHQQIMDFVLRERISYDLDVFTGIDIKEYVKKIVNHSEICCLFDRGSMTGFVAFYCNDMDAKKSFISLVMVRSDMRGRGLGTLLVNQVLSITRQRGFLSCSLEVMPANKLAVDLYRKLGFSVISELNGKWQMLCDFYRI